MNWKHIATILTATTLPALITALAGHPLTWATFAQAIGAAVTVTVAVYLQKPGAASAMLIGFALAFGDAACTPTEQKVATATAPALTTACALALYFADPSLAPLCTDIPTLVAGIVALFPEGAAVLAGDSGPALAKATAALTPDETHRLHDWLVQHGAVPLGG